MAHLLTLYSQSKQSDLQQRSLEFLQLAREGPAAMAAVLPVDASCEDVEVRQRTCLGMITGDVNQSETCLVQVQYSRSSKSPLALLDDVAACDSLALSPRFILQRYPIQHWHIQRHMKAYIPPLINMTRLNLIHSLMIHASTARRKFEPLGRHCLGRFGNGSGRVFATRGGR